MVDRQEKFGKAIQLYCYNIFTINVGGNQEYLLNFQLIKIVQ